MVKMFSEKRTASVLSKEVEKGSTQPDVVPVGFDFDGEYLYVGGMNILKSTKYKNILKNNKVAIVIDDLNNADPSDPRGIRIYGTADVVNRQGGYIAQIEHDNPVYIRINPGKKWSWGIEDPVFLERKFNPASFRKAPG
jgi:pyridoxamine 5'-phosphate oxidase family protein